MQNSKLFQKYKSDLFELQLEFAKFVSKAEMAERSNKNRLPLHVRQQSIKLRTLLKNFRQTSLDYEKEFKSILEKKD